MGKRLPSMKSLTKKLDLVFSQYIRKRDYGKPCISCGRRGPLQAGHWIKRQHRSVRWDEHNCHGQCVRCNLWLHGNDGAYALALVDKYGRGVVDDLMKKKRLVAKFSRINLECLLAHYQSML